MSNKSRKEQAERLAKTESESDNVLEVENFESLMINMDKKELQGKISTASEQDSEFDSSRAFTKEELLDQKRQSK